MAVPSPTERLTFRQMSLVDLDFVADLLGNPATAATGALVAAPQPDARD